MFFSILFSRFLIIFTIIILNYSDSLPISSSFIWTSVFPVCSFICAVFLYLLIFLFKVIVFEVFFSQASKKIEFFLWRRLNSFFLLVSALHFGHLMWRADSLEKTLMLEGLGAGGEGDKRGWGGWMASPTRWMWVWVNSGSWWWTGRPGVLQFMGPQTVGHNWVTELNWTEDFFHYPWSRLKTY